VLAIRPKTGEIVWHYQFTPNDAYDYDAVWELILAELPVNGVDADNGKELWHFQTGSGINGMPVTYTHNGQQYVTVLSGIGGLYWNLARESLKNVPPGGSVWTFALMPN
jgi:alcohol dehydrogenase (cytochrome c)